jgi:hypothetical protein
MGCPGYLRTGQLTLSATAEAETGGGVIATTSSALTSSVLADYATGVIADCSSGKFSSPWTIGNLRSPGFLARKTENFEKLAAFIVSRQTLHLTLNPENVEGALEITPSIQSRCVKWKLAHAATKEFVGMTSKQIGHLAGLARRTAGMHLATLALFAAVWRSSA